jgi:hypothetical protein
VTAPDPGRVLRRALLAWGLGHLALGRADIGRTLLAAEALAVAIVAWLTIGLADSSAYLVPFLAGMAFIVAWGWQAVHAYHAALRLQPERAPTPERSPAAAIGWLSLPLLVWGTGFWLVGAEAASPEAVLDRFVTDWTDDDLGPEWPASVVAAAGESARALGSGADRFRDVRVEVATTTEGGLARALAAAIHFERRDSTFLGLFAGSELVPVIDRPILDLELRARPVELPGGGDIGAVRWELVDAEAP